MPLLARSGPFMSDRTPTPVPTIHFTSAAACAVSNDSHDLASIAPFAHAAPPPLSRAAAAASPLAPRTDASSHKRLVPKKSKLGLLASKPKLTAASTSGTRSRADDFSDVVRRVGSSPSKGKGGFEIYVDHQDDPELGEIVVVKKQKSRKGLNDMAWGALGEVTNVPSVPKEKQLKENLLKVPKGEESQGSKWWSIGRGKKDLREKNGTLTSLALASTELLRSKSPEPPKSCEPDTRARFNSLDSATLLNDPPPRPSVSTLGSSHTLLSAPDFGFLAVPPAQAGGKSEGGSIALRAMRSMRSIARIKSRANIAKANDKDKEGNATTSATNVYTNMMSDTKATATITKKKVKEGKKKKKEKEKENVKDKENKAKTVSRYSGSSFEACTPSPQPSPAMVRTQSDGDEGGKKKRLGLGIPSTLRLGSIRNLSAVSLISNSSRDHSALNAPNNASVTPTGTRLSVDSVHANSDRRPSSTFTAGSLISSGSSLRPASTATNATGFSRAPRSSSSSSVVSVRWDEMGLRGVKETQRRERFEARENRRKESKESRQSLEGRRRTPIVEVFPEIQSRSPTQSVEFRANPIVRVEEVTIDGHDAVHDCTLEITPKNTRTRPRPLSEQMLSRMRPKGISDEADVMLSVSDAAAATNDLANLINWLDLEATPASSTSSPIRPISLRHSPSSASLGRAGEDSPTRFKGAKHTFNKDTDAPLLNRLDSRDNTASIPSLRTFVLAQAQNKARAQEQAGVQAPQHPSKAALTARQQMVDPAQTRMLIGQQIAPWSALDWQVSPKKEPSRPASSGTRPTHKRTMTPMPAADPPVVFQPLRPAAKERVSPVVSTASLTPPALTKASVYPSSGTFGSSSKPSKIGRDASDDLDFDEASLPSPSPSPIKKQGHRHARQSSKVSILSALCDSDTPIRLDAMKSLGLTGTLGGPEPEIDAEDPDSDIPDELQDILAGQSDEESTRAYDESWMTNHRSIPPSPGMPPEAPLPDINLENSEDTPMFHALTIDENGDEAELSTPASPTSSDTGKSFDFTGELRMLSESGASDRQSFVQQLESAFRTPGHINLSFPIEERSFFKDEIPPVPPLPLEHRAAPSEDCVPSDVSEAEADISVSMPEEDSSFRNSTASDTLDRLLAECEDFCRPYGAVEFSPESTRSKASNGELNTSFRFGGKASLSELATEAQGQQEKPLTLTDILAPLTQKIIRPGASFVEEDSSVLKSIFAQVHEDDTSLANSVMAQATDAPPVPRMRVHSDSSSKRRSRNTFTRPQGLAHSRNASEASFTGLESFEEIRRGFEFASRREYFPPPGATSFMAHGRQESFYSIASVSSYGAVTHPGVLDPFGYAPSRPLSADECSLGMSSSVDDTFSFLKHGPCRRRAESDASSFYFMGSGNRRNHRRNESNLSVASGAPPVSIYNRSFGSTRRSDSSGSMSPMANSYTNTSRASRARHRQEASIVSTDSLFDFTGFDLVRPGLGDKMFERDHGLPLSSISGSPAVSAFSESYRSDERMACDSTMDADRRTSMVDSLFEQTGYNGACDATGDVFEVDESYPEQESYLRANQFRPISMFSSSSSEHTMSRDDDTMISMPGGGHVRRRSIDSAIDHSPCQGRKATELQLQQVARVLHFEQSDVETPLPTPLPDQQLMSSFSPEKVILSKPSIASTSSYQFGDDGIINARRGLLDRRSLEESVLMAQGEELLASLHSTRMFSRPTRASRSRSSTVTSGVETPALSHSDCSSVSGGSQSSIDVGHLSTLLTASMQPSGGIAGARSARIRARGTGHRRRFTQGRASRSSVYETIQEESFVPSAFLSSTEPSASSNLLKRTSAITDSVYIVDADTTSISDWDDEHGIVTERKYYALKEEATDAVIESKRIWIDTPFSIFAVQNFEPPSSRDGMTALLEHSKQTYGPLPSELRAHRVRSRTSSRVSPYPVRSPRSVISPERSSSYMSRSRPFASPVGRSFPLSAISINPNINTCPPPSVLEVKSFVPPKVELEKPKKGATALSNGPRPRVTSSTRRNALGWKKRVAKPTASAANKENKENMIRQDTAITASESLRLSRPRPKRRPASARKPVPVAFRI